MPIPIIIISKQYRASCSGSATRKETCEKCGNEFSYEVQANMNGYGSSPFFLTNEKAQRDAQHRAALKLDYALKNRQAAVACPHCGWYQSAMVKSLLYPRMRGLRLFAWITLLAGTLILLMVNADAARHKLESELPFVIGELVIIVLWIGALLLRKLLVSRYDPNRRWTPKKAVP